MTKAAAATDFAPLLERCFLFDAVERSYEISGITGRVPSWLRGCYYVNGPARFERAGQRYKHWLDGDGMVCALRFTDQGVHFTSRFVQTQKLREEEAAGRFLYRGFGTAFPGNRLRRGLMLEPPVNVSVYPYSGSLLAFGEQTLPIEMDPLTLETIGEYDFHGSLNEVSPFAAHAKRDPTNRNLVDFGISYSAERPVLNVYEFSAEGKPVRRRRHALKFPNSLHDFGITPRNAVFFLSPLLLRFDRFAGEGATIMESLSWEPEKGSQILVVPREPKKDAFSVEAGRGYCLHMINCFEDGEGLIVDVLELDEPVYREYQPVPDLFATVAPGRPVRYVIDCQSRMIRERVAMDYDRTPDFPSIDTSRTSLPYADFWMLGISASGQQGRKFFDQLARGCWKEGATDVYQVPSGEYIAGEPVYVSNPRKPGEAVVIVQHLQPSSNSASFLLFDAFALKGGPIARLPLRHRVHPGFHSSFLKAGKNSGLETD